MRTFSVFAVISAALCALHQTNVGGEFVGEVPVGYGYGLPADFEVPINYVLPADMPMPGGYPTGGYANGGYPTGGYANGGYPTGGYANGGYPTGGYRNGGYAGGWGYPQGWGLTNSEVLTGGSARAGQNVLSSGSTSADAATFTNGKTHSRTRGSSTIDFGMIGGDGGDNNNVHKTGIEYIGGGITNFLSKTQGINNQGVNSGSDLWRYLQGGYLPYGEGGYAPQVYPAESYTPGMGMADPMA